MRLTEIKKNRLLGITAIFALGLLAGCARNPEVVKKKYFDRGTAYFEKGQYADAAIEYRNAIRIDPGFAQAHYQLAKSFLKLTDGNRAYLEMQRTVEIEPANWDAQLDLARLLLSARSLSLAR